MKLATIGINRLAPHPSNSNTMSDALLAKLKSHIERTGRYPPVIVRPVEPHGADNAQARYQILDGHHRVEVLRKLGHTAAQCIVWRVDDAEALLLLATLNRLEGQDDPRRRAALLTDLASLPGLELADLATQLPESADELQQLLTLHQPPQTPREPMSLADMPVAVHFFLLPAQRDRVEQRLRQLGGPRETALMTLVDAPPAQ